MNGPTLRALTIGELLDKAFSIYRRRFPLLVGIVAAALIPGAVLQLLGVFFLGAYQAIATLPQSFLQILAQVALVAAVTGIYLEKEVTLQSAYSDGGRRYWSVWGAGFLIGLALGVPLIFFIACVGTVSQALGLFLLVLAMPVLVFFSTRWSLASVAIINEGIGATDGLKRSWALTENYFWKVLVTSFMATLLTLLISYLPSLFAEFIMTSILSVSFEVIQLVDVVITQLALLITMPFSTAVIVLIYYDLRIRKEGFDLQLMADEIVGPEQPKPDINF